MTAGMNPSRLSTCCGDEATLVNIRAMMTSTPPRAATRLATKARTCSPLVEEGHRGCRRTIFLIVRELQRHLGAFDYEAREHTFHHKLRFRVLLECHVVREQIPFLVFEERGQCLEHTGVTVGPLCDRGGALLHPRSRRHFTANDTNVFRIYFIQGF